MKGQTIKANMNVASSSPRPRNWLLAKSRQWHTWGGLAAGLFLLLVGVSGIVLNYKKPVFRALGMEGAAARPDKSIASGGNRTGKTPPPRFTTAAGLTEMPTSIERACELARATWGDVPLERVEVKSEHGALVYKFKQRGGQELWVNAVTGEHFTKSEYERFGNAGADGTPLRQTDWGKILIDLHTGKIAGEAGKAVMSVPALLLVFLSLSGVYMWAKPLFVRRSHARARAAAPTVSIGAGAPVQSR